MQTKCKKNKTKLLTTKCTKRNHAAYTLGGPFGPPWPIYLQYISREGIYYYVINEYLYWEQAIYEGN